MDGWLELTFPLETGKGSLLVIDDERVSLLADPLRRRILETLGEGKTVAEISSTLGVTDSRILRHLERLAESDVVHLQETGSDPRAWRCVPAAARIRIRETLDQTANTPEPVPPEVVSQFIQAFRESADGIFGPRFQSSVNHNRARLSERQAAEFNRRLLDLIEEYFPPGKGDPSGIKYGFFGVLTPIDLAPLES
ncbi:MAG: helix-turn-helix transcriptional regulator [Candidatus Latescibacteria bacterium]|nr:helix-turn-helix transcriptional regulator [Candidatus Latescibacterota bacterium]